MVMPDNCVVCEKRIRFGKTAVKCKECRGVCHVECKEKLPLPCIPLLNTPNGRNGLVSLVRNLLASIFLYHKPFWFVLGLCDYVRQNI